MFAVKSEKRVYKIPHQHREKTFDVELDAVENAAFATETGFVPATIIPLTTEILNHVPVQNKASRVLARPIVTMPLVDGRNLLNCTLNNGDTQMKVIHAIVSMVCKLAEQGWCNSDLKLENIMLTNENRIVFLDWGSLCRIDSDKPTATYRIEESPRCAKSCASLAAVLTIAEIFGQPLPETDAVPKAYYDSLKEDVLAQIVEPHSSNLKQQLA